MDPVHSSLSHYRLIHLKISTKILLEAAIISKSFTPARDSRKSQRPHIAQEQRSRLSGVPVRTLRINSRATRPNGWAEDFSKESQCRDRCDHQIQRAFPGWILIGETGDWGA